MVQVDVPAHLAPTARVRSIIGAINLGGAVGRSNMTVKA
jgi:hypothetical protein